MVLVNKGISFGLNFPALELMSIFFLIILMVIWWKNKKAWGIILMVIGGGLNLIERFKFGGVRDYWQIPMTSIYNNFNDYLIFFGVVQLIWYFIWKKRQK
jgi:lipoprotein signal peptidase